MNLEVKLAKLPDVKTVLLDDEIYNRISDDNCLGKDEFFIPRHGVIYFGGYIEGEIASLFVIHGDNKMHFMVLKKFRRFARELLREHLKKYPHKIWVAIPVAYMEVINFAKKMGFKQIDTIKGAYLKNGKLYDEYKLIYEG